MRFCRRQRRPGWQDGYSARSRQALEQFHFLEVITMKSRLFVLFAAVAFTATSLSAQQDTGLCPGTTSAQRITQDACQKAVDLFKYTAPQLGTAIAGGN